MAKCLAKCLANCLCSFEKIRSTQKRVRSACLCLYLFSFILMHAWNMYDKLCSQHIVDTDTDIIGCYLVSCIPVVGAPPPDTPLTVQIISPRPALWPRVAPRVLHVAESSKLIFRVASIKWATVDSQGRGGNIVRGRGRILHNLFHHLESAAKAQNLMDCD